MSKWSDTLCRSCGTNGASPVAYVRTKVFINQIRQVEFGGQSTGIQKYKRGNKKGRSHCVYTNRNIYKFKGLFPISMSNDSSLLLYVSRPFSPVDSVTAVFSYNLVITVFSSFMSNDSPLLLYVNWPVFFCIMCKSRIFQCYG